MVQQRATVATLQEAFYPKLPFRGRGIFPGQQGLVACQDVLSVRVQPRDRGNQGRQERYGHEQADHDQAGDGHAVLDELAQHDLPHRPGLQVPQPCRFVGVHGGCIHE